MGDVLKKFLHAAGQCGKEFLRSERGNATVEFVFMVPLFAAIILLSTDAAILYNNVARFESVSRDTARIVARNGMTADEGKAYAISRATSPSVTPTVSVVVANGLVTVSITATAASMTANQTLSFVTGKTLTATAINTMEPI